MSSSKSWFFGLSIQQFFESEDLLSFPEVKKEKVSAVNLPF